MNSFAVQSNSFFYKLLLIILQCFCNVVPICCANKIPGHHLVTVNNKGISLLCKKKKIQKYQFTLIFTYNGSPRAVSLRAVVVLLNF